MPDLKLAKLPDRTPVKIAITVQPELNAALRQYAEVYRTTYGEAESISELIPFMLDAFLASDRGFAKAQKGGLSDAPPDTGTRRRTRRASSQPSLPTSTEE
ncbi:MAG: DUF2274 domain-containing protein [Alphaproteobacteria bacterium]|nr:DUF2274 domain-containing protein [Alphaproteobacteria bacterium]MDE2110231.1 DUF2274 domain-containing protein [Alphaproteobacteria bacterium]MDE2496140.1 DUF2274 domain-containing protein [Alphaproteobacteria bacterium]